ncbi:hypothetical protein LPJ53_005500 [Coemansia erecta]|uniref:BHLH domain-containing protein n=1 Tax=Coemansia erecta TaxID=147472 RepID=A0A9W7XVJ0_9FUNG|nr:hypothetical protein LPJ53_005500 [Coemansia erecta]
MADTAASAMSPLTIGMEGLTEQQAAEVVEMLTPFMSPSGTPAFHPTATQGFISHPATPLVLGQAMGDGMPQHMRQAMGVHGERDTFSPLTSPALVPQPGTFSGAMPTISSAISGMASGEQHRTQHQLALQIQQQQQQQQQYGAVDAVSMPPPSPSITVEHIMRRQQQMFLEKQQLAGQARMQGSPSFNTTSPMFTYSPAAVPIGRVGSAGNGAAAGATAGAGAVAGGGKARRASGALSATASPYHQAYRTAGSHKQQQQQQQQRQHHQQQQQPQTMARVAEADEFSLDTLPQAAFAAAMASLHNTPVLQFSTQQQQQQDPAMAAAVNASLAGLNLPDAMVNGGNPADRTLHQLNPQPSQGGAATATPASLLNLPLSAHHLPHTSSGEIITTPEIPARPSQPSQHSQHSSSTDAAIAATLAELTRGIPIATPLLGFVTQSAPMGELVHPPLPPPLHIGPASDDTAAEAPGVAGGRRGGRRKSTSTGVAKGRKPGESRRRARATPLISPRPTPLVPSILKGVSPNPSPHTGPMASPALAPTSNTLAPPTPQTRPRPIVAATSTTNIVGLEADVVTRLATKSNYQNILEGNSELLGLRYHKEFKTGLERRRTNHKQAEQKRRDSLKACFEQLKDRLPGLDPKLVSKIYLLRRAHAHIDLLAKTNGLLMDAARASGVDVDAIVASAAAELEAQMAGQDEDEDDDGEDGEGDGDGD